LPFAEGEAMASQLHCAQHTPAPHSPIISLKGWNRILSMDLVVGDKRVFLPDTGKLYLERIFQDTELLGLSLGILF
jgi:hypothetical protein